VPLQILHRDEALCAIMKPSGLAVHRGWAAADHYALDLLRDQLGARVYPVHRLDQPTSGVLVFALSPEVAGTLGEALMARTVDKRYLALVRGIAPEALRLEHPVKDDNGAPRPAVTDLRRLWIFRRRYSLVEARPRTGRTHQIRRHLKHLSCPIIGDTSYGKSEHNRLFAAEFDLGRLALHAAAITFAHPVSGASLTITAPLPPDLLGPLTAMGCPPELLDVERPESIEPVAPPSTEASCS